MDNIKTVTKLRATLDRRNITLTKFALLCGIEKSKMSRLLNLETAPTAIYVARLLAGAKKARISARMVRALQKEYIESIRSVV